MYLFQKFQQKHRKLMTLVGFELGTTRWQAKFLTTTPKILRNYAGNKLQYLNLVLKTGYITDFSTSHMGSGRAHSELLCFQTFWDLKNDKIRLKPYVGCELDEYELNLKAYVLLLITKYVLLCNVSNIHSIWFVYCK